MNLLSWNVNGIRAVERKGLLEWLYTGEWDVIGLQETKAQSDQLEKKLLERKGYKSYWSSAEKKGYSGTALFIKEDLHPVEVLTMGNPDFDSEGRTIAADFGSWVFVNCYFPNSQDAGKRLDYKIAFNKAIHKFCDEMSKGNSRPVVLCGDYNVAHQPVDLARPDDNETSPGYLPEEREWMSEFLGSGYTDSFRHLHPNATERYSWWSYRTRARERNIGWRIDYHCINSPFADKLLAAEIHDDIEGSDHCPVSVELNL